MVNPNTTPKRQPMEVTPYKEKTPRSVTTRVLRHVATGAALLGALTTGGCAEGAGSSAPTAQEQQEQQPTWEELYGQEIGKPVELPTDPIETGLSDEEIVEAVVEMLESCMNHGINDPEFLAEYKAHGSNIREFLEAKSRANGEHCAELLATKTAANSADVAEAIADYVAEESFNRLWTHYLTVNYPEEGGAAKQDDEVPYVRNREVESFERVLFGNFDPSDPTVNKYFKVTLRETDNRDQNTADDGNLLEGKGQNDKIEFEINLKEYPDGVRVIYGAPTERRVAA